MVQVRRLPGPLSEGLPPARYPVSKTGGSSGLGGSTPSPSASMEAWPSWKGSALLTRRRPGAARRFESCCLRLSFRRGRVGKTRDCYSREAGSSPAAGASGPRGRNGDDAGPSTRRLRHPTGPGRRTSQVRLLPARLRGRGAAVLASLMSSRSWVRIPPALFAARSPPRLRRSMTTSRGFQACVSGRGQSPHPRRLGGVAQQRRALACQARGRRFESGRHRLVTVAVV